MKQSMCTPPHMLEGFLMVLRNRAGWATKFWRSHCNKQNKQPHLRYSRFYIKALKILEYK